MADQPFRVCRVCGHSWNSWQDFISDPQVSLVGLQSVPWLPEASVLVFNHDRCGGMSVRTSVVRELLGEPDGSEHETEPCQGCFRDLGDLARCEVPCVVAADRRLTLRVLRSSESSSLSRPSGAKR
jgi:hypothetical protein